MARALDKKTCHHLRRFEWDNRRGAGGDDAWRLRDIVEDLFKEVIGHGTCVSISRLRQSDFDTEQMVGTKSGIDGNELLKTANHKCAEKDHHDSHRDFTCDKCSAAAAVLIAAATISRAERLRHALRDFQRGQLPNRRAVIVQTPSENKSTGMLRRMDPINAGSSPLV